MATKIKKKTPRKPKGPPWSFGFLGIPNGDQIEFTFDGVYVAGPGERFVVSNQKCLVKCLHGGKTHSKNELRVFKNTLLKERNLLEGKAVDTDAKRWLLEFWTHCKTQKRLDAIYKERDQQKTAA